MSEIKGTVLHGEEESAEDSPYNLYLTDNGTLQVADDDDPQNIRTFAPINDSAAPYTYYETYSAGHIDKTFLPLVGGTLTGNLTLPGDATSDLHAVPLQQVTAILQSLPTYDPSDVDITGGSIRNVRLEMGNLERDEYNGFARTVQCGEALALGDLVAPRNVAGNVRWFKYSRSDGNKLTLARGMSMQATSAAGEDCVVLIDGHVRNEAGWTFVAADTGKPVYASATAGGITLTAPDTVDHIVHVVGYIADGGACLLHFRASMAWGEV